VTPRVWRAGVDEAETVAGLLVEFRDWMESDWPSANAFHASVERLMEDPRSTEFLLGAAHDDAPPSGVCQLRFRFSAWTATDDCWLEDLWVREDSRRSGLGRALVEASFARAAERGCRRLELDASEANGPAIALYEQLGFTNQKLAEGRDLFLQKWLDRG
jgi:ribosomal protein S18 acetylase RimI-like enzyme